MELWLPFGVQAFLDKNLPPSVGVFLIEIYLSLILGWAGPGEDKFTWCSSWVRNKWSQLVTESGCKMETSGAVSPGGGLCSGRFVFMNMLRLLPCFSALYLRQLVPNLQLKLSKVWITQGQLSSLHVCVEFYWRWTNPIFFSSTLVKSHRRHSACCDFRQQVNSDLTLFEGSSCSKLHGKPLLSGFRSRRGAGNKVCFNFILKREAETQRIRQTRGGQHLTTFHSFSTRCGKLLCLTMRGLAAAAVQGRKSPCGN